MKYRKANFAAYIKETIPNTGMEILFMKGWNDNKAYINPNGFPYVNVSLAPFSERMRQNGHFTIYDIGFETIVVNLRYGLKQMTGKINDFYRIDGTVVWDGRTCYKLVLNNPEYKWNKYTVPKDITLTSLARDMHLGAYSIKERNNLSSYSTIKAGTTILIPSAFVKKLTLYIDKTNNLPLMQEIHDDKGFFSRYEFNDFILNPKFSAADFSTTNPVYHF